MAKKGSTRAMPSTHGALTDTNAVSKSAAAEYAAKFSDRYVPDFYRGTIATSIVSSIGVGTYLGECTVEDDAAYTDVIASAVASGVNLVDTAINYRCQRAER